MFYFSTVSNQKETQFLGKIRTVFGEIDSQLHSFWLFVELLHSGNTNTSGNIIKHNLRTSMNERTHFFIKIYLSQTSRKGWCFCGVWEMVGETYTQREDFFFPYLLLGARGCQRLHPLASSSETPLIGWVSLVRPWFSALCPNLTAWFSSRGLLPVKHLLYPNALIVLPCLLITTWKLVKAHGVTSNEPKIHGICYITEPSKEYFRG